MRVILINPPIDCVLENGNASPVTSYLFYNSAPLGLLYIASTLEAAGHTVSAIDGAAEQLNVAKVVERVVDFKPDVIGIGSFTVSFETTRRLAEKLVRTPQRTDRAGQLPRHPRARRRNGGRFLRRRRPG